MRQHDAHVSARIDHILQMIMEALGITLPTVDFADWYACGDELI